MHRDELRLVSSSFEWCKELKCMPPVLHSVNFSKPVTKYSLMSVTKERVLFMWWAVVSVDKRTRYIHV